MQPFHPESGKQLKIAQTFFAIFLNQKSKKQAPTTYLLGNDLARIDDRAATVRSHQHRMAMPPPESSGAWLPRECFFWDGE
ncbi:hypothetical protein FHS85_003451 [Rhodoligotrophos appendicifer]|uniref:hypothetical protein n=1 Tax=Rhodoligotrophos appendicifer TaxID=987056 RepID=UPI00118642B2|nr:hypothetical protein [Rhodoligotrophos appendicifer]